MAKKDKLPESAPPEELFKQESDAGEETYISKCPVCGTTVTRAMYKCEKCKKILL